MGEGMLGTKDERREGVPGTSLRREETEDCRPSAGDEERLRLTTLELRRSEFVGRLGDEGILRGSAGFLGECRPGDWGSGVWAAVWSERRFSGCERRFASLFVWRVGLGVLRPDAGPACWC
jgi:hypothetical protein